MIISLIRTLILYIVIILAIKLMGKRQISELQTSELVVTFLISNVASIPMQDTGQPLFSGIIPIAVLVSCEIIISVAMVKSSKFRKIICGSPIVIVNDGKIEQSQLRRLRLSTEDLCEQLRQLDILSLQDVAFAIVETNGKISVIKKPEKQQPDASSLGIFIPDTGIEAVVVSDGEISEFSITLCGVSKDWVYGILKGEKINIKDVFIMTANKNKDYYIVKKEVTQ